MKKFKFYIDGHKYEVSVNEIENNMAEVEVNGTPFNVEIEREEKIVARPTMKAIQTPTTSAAPAPKAGATKFIKSPLPGSIVSIKVANGATVQKGDTLLTMESMKMENNITAEENGVVKNILVTPGQNVMQDDKLIEFCTAASAPVAEATVVAQPAPAPAPAPESPKPQPKVAGGFKVTSPLPGSVVSIAVKVGDTVNKGNTLLTLESMKMENSILAERDGKVTSIVVTPGQSVMQDDLLLTIE